VHATRTFLTRTATLFAVSALSAIAACGRSDIVLPGQEPSEGGFADAGFADVGTRFDANFSDVITAEVGTDAILPPSCGNHACDGTETCSSCPEDCGLCPHCGDGVCDDGETCLTCAPDCGPCPRCGDGKCTPPDETCYTCPEDCGACAGCGNGTCDMGETCASCETDCGPCSVCGNGKCEAPYEDCANCPTDCGACATTTCLGLVTCAAGCGRSSSLGCVQGCLTGACADAVFFAQAVIECAISNLASCGGFSLACVEKDCPSQITACLDSTCTEP
jgi:hypothetical protein